MLYYLNLQGPLSSIMRFPGSDCKDDADYKATSNENTEHYSPMDTTHGQDPKAGDSKLEENTRCQLVK